MRTAGTSDADKYVTCLWLYARKFVEGSIMNTKKKLLSMLLMIMLVLAVAVKNSAVAQPATEISVINPLTGDNPLTGNGNFMLYTNQTSVGYRFNATVWVSNVNGLYAYQVHLNYNSTLLNATGAWLPRWNSTWVFYYMNAYEVPPFFDTNYVEIGSVIVPPPPPPPPPTFSGTGLLAIIEFEVIKAPLKFEVTPLSCSIEIDNTDTYLLDSSAINEIPATKINGQYKYNWVAPPKPWLEVSPSPIEYGPLPPSAVGEEFTIQAYIMKLDANWSLTQARFILNFSAPILAVVNITPNPLWTIQAVTNSTPGEIWVLMDNPTTTPSGDVLVVTIRFRITYQSIYPQFDASDLTLSNITLMNHLGEIPTTQPVNGQVIVYGLSPPPPWLEVSPTLVEYGPSPSVGQEFNVTVWIKGLQEEWNLANVTFGFVYNSTLIQPLGVIEGSFLREFGGTTFSTVMETNRVNVSDALVSLPMTYPNGEGIVATLKFDVAFQGAVREVREGPLNLTDIKLTNKNGDDILVNSTRVLHGLYRIRSLYTSTVSINIDKSSVTVGSNVTVSGDINPPRAHVNVTIAFRAAGTQTWNTSRTVETLDNGNFSYVWSTTEIGSYELKASWIGDENTLPAESSVRTVNVESPPPDVLPYIIVAILLIVVAVVAIILYYKKIRKSKKYK